MKKTILFLAVFFLYSCAEKNLQYYQQHLEEAKNKINECEETAINAFKSQDEEKLEKIEKDLECKAAQEAVNIARQKERKIEREKRNEKERLRKIEIEKAYELDLEKYKDKFSNLDYKQLITIQKECKMGFSSIKNAKCDAFKGVFENKKTEAVEALTKEFSAQELVNNNKDWCSGLKHDESKCDISKLAIEGLYSKKIEYYLTNRDELKKDFNNCLEQNKSLRKKSKFKEASMLMKTFKCRSVKQAAVKLKIYQFSKPIE